MKLTYIQTNLNRYTFQVLQIKKWVESRSQGKVLNLFAGKTKLNLDETRVDINPEFNPDYIMDAYDFVKLYSFLLHNDKVNLNLFDTIILDAPYCYDDKTEVLTNNGWKFFNELTFNDKIATLNSDSGFVEYQPPIKIYKNNYIGKMIKIKSGSVDLTITPNHNIYVKKIWKNNTFRLVEAQTLNFGCEFKADFNWKGKEKTYFILPGIKFDRHNRYNKTTAEKKQIFMDDWLKFLGIYLAEGCVDTKGTNYRVRIAQTKKENRIIIQEWLKKVNFPFLIDKNEFTIYNKQLCCYLRKFGKAKNKYIPKEIKQLSKRQLLLLLNALILGDGHRSKQKRYNIKYNKTYLDSHLSYYSISKRLIDDVYEIALKSGYVCSLSEILPNNSKNIQYSVRLGKYRKTPLIVKSKLPLYISHVDYKGLIYCVEVKNHIIYVRRGGRSVWCGNSYRKSMEMYDGNYTSRFKLIADVIPSILAEKGRVISLGYHSSFLGEKRGFIKEELCVFGHSGAQHCTIAIIEVKK